MSAMQLIRRGEHKTTKWSGGTTTELAIYPPDAEYRSGDFLWRFSTAIVEQEVSTFTLMPNISRTLMLTKGHMVLRHEGHHTAELGPYEQDRFDGGWVTYSQGQGKDLNLMCAAGCHGALRAIEIAPSIEFVANIQAGHWAEQQAGSLGDKQNGLRWQLFFCTEGQLWLRYGHESKEMETGDLLSVQCHALSEDIEVYFENQTESTCHFVCCQVFG